VTWVVGAASVRGTAFLVADVRVTWPTGASADVVQKVHVVGNHVIAGFSGSVRLGFALVERLKRELAAPVAGAWDLDVIAAKWLQRALRDEYERAAPQAEERALGVYLLIGSVDAQLRAGLPAPIAVAFAQSRMCRIRSPQFAVEWATRDRGMTIGSGAAIYAASVDSLLSQLPNMRSVTHGPEGLAAMLTLTMTGIIEAEPTATVGKYLHAAAAVWGASGVEPMLVGSGNVPAAFPRTAATYSDFVALCAQLGLAGAAGATG
jgi:hypothetical protein